MVCAVIYVAMALAMAMTVAVAGSVTETQSKPNVLYLLSDDMRADIHDYFTGETNPNVHTPNLVCMPFFQRSSFVYVWL